MDKEYTITLSQGQYLLRYSAVMGIPEKLGDMTFTATDRAIIQHMISGLFARLKTYAPYMQEYEPGKNVRMLFGDKDLWDVRKGPDGDNFFMKDPEAKIKIRLDKDLVNGAAWVGFASLVPRSAAKDQDGGTVSSPLEAAETVWPLLRALGKEQSVRESLGMRKYEHKKHGWNDDPAPGAEAAKNLEDEALFADTDKK